MDFKEKLLEIIKSRPKEVYSSDRLKAILGINGVRETNEIINALKTLEAEGELIGNKNGKYSLADTSGLLRGVLSGNAKGFAFFRPEEEGVKDFFIPNRNLNGALHGDTVLIKPDKKEESGDVGIVVKIVKRGVTEVVGTFQKGNNCGFVISDDKRFFNDLYVSKARIKGAKDGQKVVAKVVGYGDKNPQGEITEILGSLKDKGCDVLSIVRSHGIKTEFPIEVLQEADTLPNEVTKDKLKGRKDFRDLTTFTIDGDDSKDFDDAVSIEKNADGTYLLGVHIADVTEYVRMNGKIDKEAADRSTSVYFVDRVVPMLPFKLSNGICSLNENVDRLTLSCMMTIDKNGSVIDSDVVESVIRSKRRMTYAVVTKMLEGDEKLLAEYVDVKEDILLMKELADIMIKRRDDEGAIDFDTPEAKIVLDKDGRAIDVTPYERSISNRIIEEFMILANRTVAEKMYYLELPFIYRVHEEPSEEKLNSFSEFVNALGIFFKKPQNGVHSKNFAQLLGKLHDNVLYLIVNKVMLRSMQKAKYSATNAKHFGLSADFYCHFTSPIRRYPDLFVHRMLKFMLRGKFDDRLITDMNKKAVEVAAHASEKEKVADEAERDVDDLKKTEFMATKLGEEFEGIVSGVTSFGVFVELPNTCEGLIRIENLDGGVYEFNEKMYTLSDGQHSYRLGDKVKIKVVTADVAARRVNFVFVK